MLQPASQPYVGIDLHRRRSVIVQRSAEGETLAVTQVSNDNVPAFAKAVTDAGEHPEVVIEACYGRALSMPQGTGATSRPPSNPRSHFARITANHGDTQGARKVARVAVARKIVTLVYYGLRDGFIRSRAICEAA